MEEQEKIKLVYVPNVSDEQKLLKEQIKAVCYLLKPNYLILTEKINIDLKYILPSTLPEELKQYLFISEIPPFELYNAIGSANVVQYCKNKQIKLCLSYNYENALLEFGKYTYTEDNCLYFHPGQKGYSLSFLFFEMNKDFSEIKFFHPHLNIYHILSEGLQAAPIPPKIFVKNCK